MLCKLSIVNCSNDLLRALKDEGFSCQISPRVGESICILFESEVDVIMFLDKVDLFVGRYIEDVWRWQVYYENQDVVVWVLLEDVLLKLWNIQFFEAFVNKWGKYVKSR